MLEKAKAMNLILVNPMIFLPPPVHNQKEKKYIDKAELEKFFKISKKSKYGLYYNLLILTGMRVGELLALKKDDFDLKNKTIIINKSFNFKIKKVAKTKTKSSVRVIPIPNLLLHDIENNIKNNNDSLFCTFSYSLLARELKSSYSKAFNSITLHSLRHSFATILHENNVDYKTISELLGHKNINTTMDIYAKFTKEQFVKVSEKLDDIF